jgi:hypothetical protein
MGMFDGLASGLFGGPNVNQPGAQINQDPATAWQGNPGAANGNQAAQQTAQGLELAQAEGTGPSAATELLKQQTAQAQNNANALASSGAGASGQGVARRNAMLAGVNATQNLGGQAAAARAGEQQAGVQGLGNMSNQARGLDLQASGINANLAAQQAQLAQQQNIENQGVAAQQQGANAGTLGNLASAAASAAPLLMMSDKNAKVGIEAADADLREPPNPADPGDEAHLSLREEPSVDGKPFLLTYDHQTGRAYKPLMQELSPEEERVAFDRPHGAGDFGSPDRQRTVVHDFDLVKGLDKVRSTRYPSAPQKSDRATMDPAYRPMSDDGFANMVQSAPLDQSGPYKQAAHRPGLYAANSYEDVLNGKQYAQGEGGMPDTAEQASDKESQMGAVSGAQGDPRTNGDNSDRDWSRAGGLSYADTGSPDGGGAQTQQPAQPPQQAKSRISPWRAPDGSGNYNEGWDDAIKPKADDGNDKVSGQLNKLSSSFGNFGNWSTRIGQPQSSTVQVHDLDMDSFDNYKKRNGYGLEGADVDLQGLDAHAKVAQDRMKSQHGTWPESDPHKNWGRMDEVSPPKGYAPWQETNQQVVDRSHSTGDDIPTTDENSWAPNWYDDTMTGVTDPQNSKKNPLILDEEPVDETAPNVDYKNREHQTAQKVRGNETNADLDLGPSRSYADRLRGHIEGADVDLQPGASQNFREAEGAARITRDPHTGVQTGERFDIQNPDNKPIEQGGPPETMFSADGSRWVRQPGGGYSPAPPMTGDEPDAKVQGRQHVDVKNSPRFRPGAQMVAQQPVSPPQQAAQQAATATKAVTGAVDQQVAAQMAQKAAQQAVAQSIQKAPNAAAAATLPRPTIQGGDIDLQKSTRKQNVNGDAVNPEGIRPTGTDPGIAAITSDKMKKTDVKKIGESTNHGGPRDTEANADRSTTDTGDRGGAQQTEAKRSDSTSGRKDGNTQHTPSGRDESSYGAAPKHEMKHGDYYGAKQPSLANGVQNGSAWYEPLFKGDPAITRGADPWGHPGETEDRIHAADLDMGSHMQKSGQAINMPGARGFADDDFSGRQNGGAGGYRYDWDPGSSRDDRSLTGREMGRDHDEFTRSFADMDFSHAVGVREPVSMSRYRELPSLDDDNASVEGFDERMPLPRPSLREQSENGLGYLRQMREEAMRGMEPGKNLRAAQGLEAAQHSEPRAAMRALEKKRMSR